MINPICKQLNIVYKGKIVFSHNSGAAGKSQGLNAGTVEVELREIVLQLYKLPCSSGNLGQ